LPSDAIPAGFDLANDASAATVGVAYDRDIDARQLQLDLLFDIDVIRAGKRLADAFDRLLDRGVNALAVV
jgi:hypothetical protein